MNGFQGDRDKFSREFSRKFDEFIAKRQRPVVLVTGAAGSGKSTLVNLVLNRDVALVGAGRPVTQTMDRYENENIIVFDSKGYESGEVNQNAFFSEIEKFIRTHNESFSAAASNETGREIVNIVWHCVSAPAARFLDVDQRIINFFKEKQIPIAVVLTQVDCASESQCSEIAAVIREANPILGVFESTSDFEVGESLIDGIPELYEWTKQQLPEALRLAFMCAARRDAAAKLEKGKGIAMETSLEAAAVGGFPIPYADTPILVGLQLALLYRLATLWGVGEQLKQYGVGFIVDVIMGQLGKRMASELSKLVPGIGSAVNAAVAGGLTYLYGQAVNYALYKYVQSILDGKPIPLLDALSPELLETFAKMIREQNPDDTGMKKWIGRILKG